MAPLRYVSRELKSRGLDGFVVPLTDGHRSEYVGAYAQRLAWLTGFGGSAGTAVVLADEALEPAAAIFIAGREPLQVRDQVDIARQKAGIPPGGSYELRRFRVIRYRQGDRLEAEGKQAHGAGVDG